MYLFDFFISNLVWSQGWYILLTATAIALIGYKWAKPLMYVSLLFLLFTFYFFRNPQRICEVLENTLVSPADGQVIEIVTNLADCPGFTKRISIFLSPFDVHVNYAPCAGTVERVVYTPGSFYMAWLPKSSALNEHNDVYLKDNKGRIILVRQIAGILARRISCWVSEHSSFQCGQSFGMIKFGSRVDLFLPDGAIVDVTVGQKVTGAQTIVASWVS